MILSLLPALAFIDGLSPGLLAGLIGGAGLFLLLLIGAWLVLGRGPRRARGYRRCQRLLRQGKWSEALQIVEDLQHGRLSPFWQGRLRNAEGECHRAAGVAAIQAKE